MGTVGFAACVDQACTGVAVVLGAALIVAPEPVSRWEGPGNQGLPSAIAVGLEVSTKGGGDVREGAPNEGRFRGRRAHGA